MILRCLVFLVSLALVQPALAANPDDALRVPIPAPAPMTEGIADLGNVRLHYWDTGGAGEPIVFLHPGSGSDEFYAYQQPFFANAGYRVIAYSRRNQGQSDLGNDTDTFFAVDDLLALTKFLKVERFHAVGNALGGYVGIDLALLQPERLKSLTLASSMMGIAEPDYQKTLESLRPKPFDQLPAAMQELGPSYRAANPAGVAEWNARHDRADKRAPARFRNKFTWETIATLKTPVLLMTGDADLWIPPTLLRAIAPRFPNHEIAVVTNAGHAIQWEQPDAFNQAVLNFIRGKQ